jgi:polysaccharide deacetylase family protein (PEP-CTERM system associated)
MAGRIKNAMSIDVEDYFQVSAFAPHIRRADWDSLPCRVERNVDVILGLLDEADASATFFTLGWIAERYPQVVRRIVDNGHELASHGYGHQRASDLTPAEFRDDITHAKSLLEDLGGVVIRGYRAPSFSISQKNWWAVGELENAGYVYSSSIIRCADDLRHARRAALPPPPNGEAGVLNCRHHAAAVRPQPARWAWLVRTALRNVALMLRRVNVQDQARACSIFHLELDAAAAPARPVAQNAFHHYVNLHRMPGRIRHR